MGNNVNGNQSLDITPTPRILRVLGEIPFQPWQCLAELIDNSIDAFIKDEEDGTEAGACITVNWSGTSVPNNEFSIEINDNAEGMGIEQINNAVRAGYSSNDPVHNLGLFGMGFNIATAKLGEKTQIVSTKEGDDEWIGVQVDFAEMIEKGTFAAPIVHLPKDDKAVHGTRITITEVKEGIRSTLLQKEGEIRKQLENIYSPLLANREITIAVKGRGLFPKNHCVWASTKYVIWDNTNVPAVIQIDRDFGDAYFDTDRNTYCTQEEAAEFEKNQKNGMELPPNIILRSKRLTGWLGIQRYCDPNDFGIDFIRNGRKILISDKSLFQYDNPLTGTKQLQYPIELGTTIGGRIVGELNVDYLLPTYQKNDFDRTDYSWAQTVEAICGQGPFLPKLRKSMGFSDAPSAPLARLVNAYRRSDPGTKNLAAPNQNAKLFYTYFLEGKAEYLNDDKWWLAAQEEDQKKASGGGKLTGEVNDGNAPSDDVDSYFGGGDSTQDTQFAGIEAYAQEEDNTIAPIQNSSLDDLLLNSTQVVQWSAKYSYSTAPALNVKAYELNKGDIKKNGESKPCFFHNSGIDCTFVYNPRHPIISQYPITAKMLLLQYLAERFKNRDAQPDIVDVYAGLMESAMSESKIDRFSLQEKAQEVFGRLREGILRELKGRAIDVIRCVHESTGDIEETISGMFADGDLIKAFQNQEEQGFTAIDYVPERTLIRIVDRFPESMFDKKVFNAPYNTIQLQDDLATERSRNESKDRIMSYLKDALRVASNTSFGQKDQKNELSRAALSIEFLLQELG